MAEMLTVNHRDVQKFHLYLKRSNKRAIKISHSLKIPICGVQGQCLFVSMLVSSVTQGSNLGRLTFIIYFNEVVAIWMPNSKYILQEVIIYYHYI